MESSVRRKEKKKSNSKGEGYFMIQLIAHTAEPVAKYISENEQTYTHTLLDTPTCNEIEVSQL
jgi:hypothetical protein